MRKSLFILACILLLAFIASLNAQTITSTSAGRLWSSGSTWAATNAPHSTYTSSGLVSYWPAEGNANDAVGTNHGTLMNGATFAPGRVGQAFSFDGVNDYVDVGNDPSLSPTNAITVEAWINAAAWAAYFPMFVSKGINESYFLSEYGDASGSQAVFRIGSDGVVGTSELQTNTWYHIVGTYDGTEMKIYVNGNLEGTTYRPGSIPTTSTPLAVGGPANFSGYRFNGLIDDVRIYDRALTSQEVSNIYNAAPIVVSTSPSNGSTGVPVNTVITTTFLDEMNESTITTSSFTVSGGVTGTVTYNATTKVATFTPSSNLADNTTYTATITTAVKNAAGNNMAAARASPDIQRYSYRTCILR